VSPELATQSKGQLSLPRGQVVKIEIKKESGEIVKQAWQAWQKEPTYNPVGSDQRIYQGLSGSGNFSRDDLPVIADRRTGFEPCLNLNTKGIPETGCPFLFINILI
jgi:hypothetical protein